MKNFNVTRFGHVLKLDFAEGRKAMMWGAICMLLLYLFFFWFVWNIGMHARVVSDWDVYIYGLCKAVSGFSMMALYIFFLVTASTLYRGEQKKQQRIAWLMLPATNMEKFLSRWIYMLVFMLVGGVLPIILADCIHIVWLQMTDYPVQSMTKVLVHNLPHVDKNGPILEIMSIYFAFVAIHSIYLLGGVFFKKFHFIATSVVFAIVFSLFFGTLNSLGYRDTPTPPDYILGDIISIGVSSGIITVCTWLAYRLFCRWQVVTHKFANV